MPRVLLVVMFVLTSLPFLTAVATPVFANSHEKTVNLRIDGMT